MFYVFMRFLFRISLRLYYKRIFVSGLENLPKNKPVIFASNHPNAFMDAFLVGAFSNKTMYTLVRSDVFMNPAVTWFLGLFNLLPVYRSQEGARNLKKNDLSFQRCINELQKGHNILIFSEGTSVMGKHLLRLKKGTARLALKAHESLQENVLIVPVGLNYTHFTKRRKEVMVNFGKPISTSDYLELANTNANLALNKLSQDLFNNLKEEVIILDNTKSLEVFEQIIPQKRDRLNFPFYKQIIYSKERFLLEKQTANLLNESTENNENLKNNQVTKKTKLNFTLLLISILCLPLYLTGTILHAFTFILSEWVAKNTLKDQEYHTSVELSLAMIIFLCLAIIVMLKVSFIIAFLLIPICYISLLLKFYLDEAWLKS